MDDQTNKKGCLLLYNFAVIDKTNSFIWIFEVHICYVTTNLQIFYQHPVIQYYSSTYVGWHNQLCKQQI